MIEVALSFAEGRLVDQTNLEVMGYVECPDGLFQAAVEMVCASREIVRLPIAVRVGENLREDVGCLQLETVAITPLESDDAGGVSRVTAVVTAAGRRVDGVVLGERPKGLSHRRPAAPQCLESGEGCRDSGVNGRGRIDRRIQERRPILVEVDWIYLVVSEQIGLQVSAEHSVVRRFQHGAWGKLALDREIEIMHLGRPGGLITLPPRHTVGIGEGGVDERWRFPRRESLTQDERRLYSVAAVARAVGERKTALVSGTRHRCDGPVSKSVGTAD